MTGTRNWGRGFFRLWIALALLLVVPIGIGAVIETTKDLRLLAVYVLAMIGVVSLRRSSCCCPDSSSHGLRAGLLDLHTNKRTHDRAHARRVFGRAVTAKSRKSYGATRQICRQRSG
jgi:hypothetical protein